MLENGIRVFFSKSDPAAVLTGEFAGMLLVMEFAWDSNSYVGNEVCCLKERREAVTKRKETHQKKF